MLISIGVKELSNMRTAREEAEEQDRRARERRARDRRGSDRRVGGEGRATHTIATDIDKHQESPLPPAPALRRQGVSVNVRRVSEPRATRKGEGGDTNTSTATNKIWRTSAEVCTPTHTPPLKCARLNGSVPQRSDAGRFSLRSAGMGLTRTPALARMGFSKPYMR